MENPLSNKMEKSRSEFLLTEYEQVLITYRDNIKVLSQIITFLVIANITVLGVAFEKNNYYIFLLGAILMFILYRANHRAAQITLPVLIRGLIIEKKYREIGIFHYTLLKIHKYDKFKEKIDPAFSNNNDSNLQFQDVKKILNQFKFIILKYDLPFAISKSLTFLIIVLGIFQFILFLLAFLNKNYENNWLPNLSGTL